jgi:hypothetical protein
MRLVLLFALYLYSSSAWPQSSQTLSRLLTDLENQALQIKASENRQQADQIDLERSLYFLEPTAFLRGGYQNVDTPPTSPFSPSNSTSNELEFGLSKQWASGFKTSLNYLLEDSQTQFPTRPDFNFISPTMSLSVETDIFQDLIHKRYQNQQLKNKWQKEVVDIESKIDKKNILVQGLLDFSMILEIQEEQELQKKLCQSIGKQSENLERKRKRGTVSQREYLLGLKEFTNCQARIELLERNYLERTKGYSARYNVSFEKYSSVETNQIFQEASSVYESFNAEASQVDITNQDQVKVLSFQGKGLQAQQKELEARASNNLKLEVRSGLTGLDSTFQNSHEEMADMENPFVYVGLRIDFPIKDRDAQAQAGANRFRMSALEKQKELSTLEKSNRFETLRETLKKDLAIYEKYKKTISYSLDIIKEANIDFENGRIDFNTLTEFNKALIQDQKNFSSHRIQVIVRIVEYLDFFQFFDTYL